MTEPAAPIIAPQSLGGIRDMPGGVWVAVAALLIAISITLHALFPRYDFKTVEDGRGLVVFDRWTGVFQRANYDANGEPSLTPVVRPF